MRWRFPVIALVLFLASPRLMALEPEERNGMLRALQARVADLVGEKNESGASSRRGSYSRRFTEVGPDTYQVIFHRESAGADTLVVERLLLTLESEGSARNWRITDEQIQDTYDALTRSTPGDEEFMQFDGFTLEREGLHVTSGPGFLYTDSRKGEIVRVVFRGEALEYAYAPPLPRDRLRHSLILENHESDFVFDPEEIDLACDPATCREILATAFRGARPARREDAREELRRSYEKWLREAERERRRDAFEGFSLPYEAGRVRLTLGVKRKGGDHWLILEDDSIRPREVTLWVSEYGPVYRYPSGSSRAAIPAIDREHRLDPDRRDYDVEGFEGTVSLGFGDGEILAGDVVVTLRTLRDLRELPFTLARLSASKRATREAKDPRMTINSLQDHDGRDLTWVATGAASGLVVLPRTVPAGEILSLRVEFENRDCVYKFTPHYFYVARMGWLPFLNPGDMVPNFDLTVRVPSRFQALGVGSKASESIEENASVTRWTSQEAVNFPTVVFGGYKEAVSKVRVSKSDGTAIPVVTHVDRDSAYALGDSIQHVADQAAASLDLYQRLFASEYPYGKLDLVNDPQEALSGQAPSSMVFLGSAYDVSLRRGTGQMTKSEIERYKRSLVPHEVAHQWWGSLVGSASPRHFWFEEALAEYSSSLWFQAASDVQGYLTRVEDWRREILETPIITPLQEAYVLWSDGPEEFHAAVYAKGPYVFHMMRSIWGDTRFLEFLRVLLREYRGREIVTRDVQGVAERVFGERLDWFFDQWIRGIGIPEFTFRYATRPAADGEFVIEGEVEQRILASPRLSARRVLEDQVFRCIVYLTVTGKSGQEHEFGLDLRHRATSFKVTVPEKPKSILLNRHGETLAHDVIIVEGS